MVNPRESPERTYADAVAERAIELAEDIESEGGTLETLLILSSAFGELVGELIEARDGTKADRKPPEESVATGIREFTALTLATTYRVMAEKFRATIPATTGRGMAHCPGCRCHEMKAPSDGR
jgi:hypothetical protein